jgi:hypothetical protein
MQFSSWFSILDMYSDSSQVRIFVASNLKYCDVHAVGQQWKRLFTTIAKQRNNRRDCCFLWGPFW